MPVLRRQPQRTIRMYRVRPQDLKHFCLTSDKEIAFIVTKYVTNYVTIAPKRLVRYVSKLCTDVFVFDLDIFDAQICAHAALLPSRHGSSRSTSTSSHLIASLDQLSTFPIPR
jgi:hypothetical protein